MTESEVNNLRNSLLRAYALLAGFIRWIFQFFRLQVSHSKPVILSTKSLKTEQEEYVDKYRVRFLATFDTADSSALWNANVDAVMLDKDALAKTLEDADNELEKKWKRSVLIENTPRGNVYMFYDAYKQAFSYYSDQTVMPYEIMNAVAMKYVMTFRCRDFFVDSTAIPQKVREDGETTQRQSSSQPIAKPEAETHQPFAKFKSYNTATKKAAAANKKSEKTINRFLHLGGVRNWTPILVTKKLNPLNGFKTDMIPSNQKLSYTEYKKVKFATVS